MKESKLIEYLKSQGKVVEMADGSLNVFVRKIANEMVLQRLILELEDSCDMVTFNGVIKITKKVV